MICMSEKHNSNAKERWEHFRDTIYEAAFSTFGKKTKSSADWFDAHLNIMLPVTEEKRNALNAYKAYPTQQNVQTLRAARNKVQSTARRCANQYWLDLCAKIQTAADTGNIKGMYDGIKMALGPTQKKFAPLKSSGEVLKDSDKQMQRWVEYYSELYARENTVSDEALNSIECLPTLHELDREPDFEEIAKAMKSLASGKTPGNDGIPPEILKCCQEKTLPRASGNPGISLLSIAGKLFARVVLERLKTLADRVYPESQCGFRANRSTTDNQTWYSPYNNYKKNAGNSRNPSTWRSSI